ncbi:MAG: SpoIIE family protein phosphatase [Gammaproteobacteria bacterium]|nr:SpoIIE family protein phosphatase [Gammaproteobacteria bacterium]
MKILIIDKNENQRQAMAAALRYVGYQVVDVGGGAQAAFASVSPDRVVMDISDSEALTTSRITRFKALCRAHHVPVIFLLGMADVGLLQGLNHTEGEEFIVKPVEPAVLIAKLEAMLRFQSQSTDSATILPSLEQLRHSFDEDSGLAQHIVAAATAKGDDRAQQFLRHCVMPAAQPAGDLLLYAPTVQGGWRIMLGDFAGRGLGAAVGALPAAEIFYAMTTDGMDIAHIAAEINNRLKDYLPVGRFLAACLVDILPDQDQVLIWNGGLPAVLLLGTEGQLLRRSRSQKLPMGILDIETTGDAVEKLSLEAVASIVVYSDGVIQARSYDGVPYGAQRLEHALNQKNLPGQRADAVRRDIQAHIQGVAVEDDILLVEVDCEALAQMVSDNACLPSTPTSWSLDVLFSSDKLKEIDPLLLIMDWLDQLHLLDEQKQRLFTVISELINNAIEHGLLGLDSRLKAEPTGYDCYYRIRDERLASLESGFVKVYIEQLIKNGHAGFRLRVEDSGPGFDIQAIMSTAYDDQRAHGRGVALVRSMCHKLNYFGSGNRVEAEYFL